MKSSITVTPSAVSEPRGNTWQLMLATAAFAFCFAVFGSVSAMMPIMRKHLGFTPLQVSVALAVPILLGSLGRIPLGILTDRFGGRLIFSGVMALAMVPAFFMGNVTSFQQVVVLGFLIGAALASFSVGVGFVSGWYPAQRQGMALGVYGAGNVGQSLAAYGSPVLAGALGYVWGYRTFSILVFAWLIVFALTARNAPRKGPARTFPELIQPLRDTHSWKLSAYYFLTFGGFVAMAVYLPIFLTDIFGLTPRDAGARTAGFVLLATAMRPVGGWLSDRFSGHAILTLAFPVVAVMATLMTRSSIVPFTIGALGMAAAIGLGNGAVFKLVPAYFPHSVGAVTGLVGAAGGLGGFFPPLVLGAIRQATGAFTWGFILLGLTAIVCLVVIRPKVLALCLVPPAAGTQAAPCARSRLCSYAGVCMAASVGQGVPKTLPTH
jgi:NNP family nitrate/nitrite transporter-like MFS transporter